MFDIETFKSNFLGGARPTKFEVEVPTLPDKARFLINASSIPGATIGPIPFKYQGVEAKFAGDKTFADWSVKIVLDEDYAGFNELETWHNLIRGNGSGEGLNNHNLYKKDCIVTHYSQSGDIISQYKLVGAWPSVIPDIAVDWSQTDSMMEIDVTFSFDWRERVR